MMALDAANAIYLFDVRLIVARYAALFV